MSPRVEWSVSVWWLASWWGHRPDSLRHTVYPDGCEEYSACVFFSYHNAWRMGLYPHPTPQGRQSRTTCQDHHGAGLWGLSTESMLPWESVQPITVAASEMRPCVQMVCMDLSGVCVWVEAIIGTGEGLPGKGSHPGNPSLHVSCTRLWDKRHVCQSA